MASQMNKLFQVAVLSTILAQNVYSLSQIPDFFVVVSQPSTRPSFASTRQGGKLKMIDKPLALVPSDRKSLAVFAVD